MTSAVAELSWTDLSAPGTKAFHARLDLLSSSVPLSGFQVVAVARRNWFSQSERINSFIT